MCYINSYIRLAIDVIVLLYFQGFLFLEVALPTINRLLRLHVRKLNLTCETTAADAWKIL